MTTAHHLERKGPLGICRVLQLKVHTTTFTWQTCEMALDQNVISQMTTAHTHSKVRYMVKLLFEHRLRVSMMEERDP